MDWFDQIIPHVLTHEGGDKFTNNPQDPGGATKWGITLRTLRQAGWIEGEEGWDLNGDGDVDAEDVKLITEENARALYRQMFWRPEYDRMPFEIAQKTFDLSVNMGWRQSHKILQRAITASKMPLEDDGLIGPITLERLKVCWSRYREGLLNTQRATAGGFYRGLVMRNTALRKANVMRDNGEPYHDLSIFLDGWLNRAYW